MLESDDNYAQPAVQPMREALQRSNRILTNYFLSSNYTSTTKVGPATSQAVTRTGHTAIRCASFLTSCYDRESG